MQRRELIVTAAAAAIAPACSGCVAGKTEWGMTVMETTLWHGRTVTGQAFGPVCSVCGIGKTESPLHILAGRKPEDMPAGAYVGGLPGGGDAFVFLS